LWKKIHKFFGFVFRQIHFLFKYPSQDAGFQVKKAKETSLARKSHLHKYPIIFRTINIPSG